MFFFIVSAKAPRRILGQFVVKKRGASTRINFFSLHVPEKYSKLCRTVIKKRDQCLYRRHCEEGALWPPHDQRTSSMPTRSNTILVRALRGPCHKNSK